MKIKLIIVLIFIFYTTLIYSQVVKVYYPTENQKKYINDLYKSNKSLRAIKNGRKKVNVLKEEILGTIKIINEETKYFTGKGLTYIATKSKIDKFNNYIEDIKQKVNQIDQTINQINEGIDNINKINYTKQKLDKIKTLNINDRLPIIENQIKLERLDVEKNALKNNMNAQILTVNNQIKNLETQITDLDKQVDNNEKEKNKLLKDLEDALESENKLKYKNPGYLNTAMIDLLTGNKVDKANADVSVQVLDYYVGTSFLRLNLLGGASTNCLNSKITNKQIIGELLLPTSGLLNFSFIFNMPISPLSTIITNNTFIQFEWQIGVKLVSEPSYKYDKTIPFALGYSNVGFYCQTRVFSPETSDSKKEGTLWFQPKFIVYYSESQPLNQVLTADYNNNWQLIYFSITDPTVKTTLSEKKYRPNANAKNYLLGYSFEAGLYIQEVINIKVGLYHILNIKKYGFQFPYMKIAADRSFDWIKPTNDKKEKS